MRVVCLALFVGLLGVCTWGTAHAQESENYSKIDLGVGGGFTEPAGRAGDNVNMGWNIDVRGGYRATRNVALDLDFNYNRWNLNSAALARYGEPGGYTTIWSVSFNPVLYGSPHWHISPYVTGGPGLYYRNLSLTQPGLINSFYCDPFFGYCFPATFGVNQVVASATTYKMGFNAGAGLEFPLGHSPLKVFGEARYSRMFTTHGNDIAFVPVTFGLRW
jgi:opacity protein-like surface antigen